MRICGQVANASKHRNLEFYAGNIEGFSEVVGRNVVLMDGTPKEVHSFHHVQYFSIQDSEGHRSYGVNQFAHEVEDWLCKLVDEVLPAQ